MAENDLAMAAGDVASSQDTAPGKTRRAPMLELLLASARDEIEHRLRAVASPHEVGSEARDARISHETALAAENFAVLLQEALAYGWNAAIASARYEDGTPVELVSNVNPFKVTA